MANVINGIKINDTLYDLNLSSLGSQEEIKFKSKDNAVYSLFVDNYGKIALKQNLSIDERIFLNASDETMLNSGGDVFSNEGNGYYTFAIKISEIVCGGVYVKNNFCAATHNFVMLSNFSRVDDFCLDGLYLMYKGSTDTKYTPLALHGIIKSGSTFLIRGAKCSDECSDVLNVNTYDQEWYSEEGELLAFDTLGSTFYLCTSVQNDPTKVYNGALPVNANELMQDPTRANSNGYMDLVGFKTAEANATGDGGAISVSLSSLNQLVFVRYNMLDPSTNVNYTGTSKNTNNANWTYYNRLKYSKGNLPYYTTEERLQLTPAASFENKTIQDFRTTFKSNRPNHITCTFGYQATDGGTTKRATRCFNWISTGRYDEYVEYVKVSDTVDRNIQNFNPAGYIYSKKYSIEELGNYPYTIEYADDAVVETYIKVYDRNTWKTIDNLSVTTHKAIIRGLTAGTYLYRICRDNDLNYYSEYKLFYVQSDTDVNTNGFSFVHTTDQQGFNLNEYKAWEKCAYAINHDISNYDFLINTGDVAQSGSKQSEWLDYHKGLKHFNGRTDMTTLGNNDMGEAFSDVVPNNKSKINPMTIWLYNTYELDVDNSTYFTYKVSASATKLTTNKIRNVISYAADGSSFTYFCPSTYSFNYGNYHFCCINSEMSNGTNKVNSYFYTDTASQSITQETFKKSVYANLYKWTKTDIEKHKTMNMKQITYMHEIPLCIIAPAQTSATNRGQRTVSSGSALNIDFSSGLQNTNITDITTDSVSGGFCFSELFQNNNVKLCLGGHKHTYSLTHGVKENISYSNSKRTVSSDTPILHKFTDSNQELPANNGVVYAMAQASGYKLVSNKELPGTGAEWNFIYFPCSNDGSGNKASVSQYYPTIHHVTCKSSQIEVIPYYITNVYPHTGNKYQTFETNTVNNTDPVLEQLKTNDKPVKLILK